MPTNVRIVLGSAKRWALGCVNSLPAAREKQEAGFTQPWAHLLANPCTTSLLVKLRTTSGSLHFHEWQIDLVVSFMAPQYITADFIN